MADFVDSEAEESDREDDDVDEEMETQSIRRNRKAEKRKKQIDSSEEEDEDDDEEVVQDLIDDNPIEDEESDNESTDSRQRKKSDDEDDLDDRLEDEDYDLLEENLGVKVQRKKFKRLKRMEDAESDDEAPDKADEREAIANQLFEGSDDEGERERPERRDETVDRYALEESEGEYSETDGFIVDDEDRPIAKQKRRPIFSDVNLQEAQDIFGVDFDYDEFEKYDEEEYEDEEDEDEDEYENEEEQTIRRAKKLQRRRRKVKSLYEIYEPHELERAGITDEDNRIRSTDIPERMQLRLVPVVAATEEELEEEAEWIYKLAFKKFKAKERVRAPESSSGSVINDTWSENWDQQSQANSNINNVDESWETTSVASSRAPSHAPSVTGKSVVVDPDENWDTQSNADWEKNDGAETVLGDSDGKSVTEEKSAIHVQEEVKPKVIDKIKKSLEFMRNQHLEVPFISFYRKEYVEPELKIDDLWKIYRLDARFYQLNTRRHRLCGLFKNMKNYQTDFIVENPDASIDSMRLITDDDIERIKNIKTQEELKDMYLLFSLYYSEDVPAMKDALTKKQKEERQRAKESAAAAAAAEGEEPENSPPEPEIEEVEVPSLKRKIGGGAYALCKKLGIDSLVKKFGLSPDKFAENLRDNYQRYEVDQYPTDPEETAKEHLNDRIKSESEALKAAKFMLATQISREPLVRQAVREHFFEKSVISIRPTKKGIREIDESHPCFAMKYVKDKPVRDLTGDQFLKLHIAEEDKLLTISLGEHIQGITMNTSYVDEVKQLFHKDEFSKTVLDWNNLREEVVEYALEKLLFPVMRKELRAKLLEDAKEFVTEACTYNLWNGLKVAPYKPAISDDDDEDWDCSKGIRVMSIAYVPDLSQSSFAVIVSPDGEPTDYIRLQNLMKSLRSFRESDREDKAADLLTLKNLIKGKKPHVIVIGGESRDAMMLQDDVRNIVADLVTEEGFPSGLNVEIVENNLAKVYANSMKANYDFREFPGILREAISLARRIQDPLIEFSQLCNADEELLCVRFHQLQDQISREELLERLYCQFINRVNETGVDINRCISSPHTANIAQFICGLGVRKATSLIKTLKQNNQRLENRTQLITVCHMGPKIFINCSGFIKIDTNSLGDSTEAYVEVLDGSRVHPETYEWARKMAVDALEYDDEDANPASALEEILDAPERLKDLDLDAFAEELERQGFGNKSITLYDIRAELNHRYKDLRETFQSLHGESLFNTLTKETPETLYVGKLTTATVIGISHKKPQGEQLDNAIPVRNEQTGMWQCAFCMKNDFPDLSEVWNHFDAGACPGQATGVRVRLDNGISGFIPIAKLSDKAVTNPESRVRRGQTIHCRIIKIDVDRFSVECTSRTSDLIDAKNEWKVQKDPYYDQSAEEKDIKKEEDVKKNRQRQTYVRRVIVHPSFKNISYKELAPLMDQMDQGEVIVRPSSKGPDHLTVSWKVADGIYQHIDVKEEGKENAFSLGQSLWISNEEYEDLDEIIARHINPMASHARDIINYKYYEGSLGGNRQKADEFLREEKQKNANKIHYVLHPSKDIPGKFVLSYMPSSKVQHEYITVTPEGYRYRQQGFPSLNQTLKWFKDHYRDPPPASITPHLTPKTHAARTPGMAGTPGYDGSGKPSAGGQYGVNHGVAHTTPHYTTPAQGFTPYSAFTTHHHTPYTPTAQTPYITPYQTPYQSSVTPRASSNQGTGAFLHPGAVTPGGYKVAPQRRNDGPPTNENSDWRRAAEAWAKSQQKSSWPQQNRAAAPGNARYAGAPQGGSRGNNIPPGALNNIHQIMEGAQRSHASSALNYVSNKSPRSGRESLRSTPRTNFSPRSMVESSLGDETPLHDEN